MLKMNDTDHSSPPSPSRNKPTAAATDLTIELADLIRAIAVQRAAIASLWNPTSIAQPLNVLSRSATPLPTKVALMHLPHVDLDTATKLNDVDLLKFMLAWSKQPGGRPVNYNEPITLAMRAGHLSALNWWVDESALCFKWDVEAIKAACHGGRVDILEWWAVRGFPRLAVMDSVLDTIVAASEGGHVHVLDWLWSRLPNARVHFEDVVNGMSYHYCGSVMKYAAQSGSIEVLDWWVDMGKSELSKTPSLAPIIATAFYHGHAHVLEWCKLHPEVLAQQRTRPWNTIGGSPLTLATMNRLLDWIDVLGMWVFQDEYSGGSWSACAQGDIQALEYLQRKGYLVGSRGQLTSIAAASSRPTSTIIDTLEWIRLHVDAGLADSAALADEITSDPVRSACAKGKVQVLDWLNSHGYYKLDLADLARCFKAATRNCHVHVLDWLLIQSSVSADELQVIASDSISLDRCDLATWKWWLGKCGPLGRFAESFALPVFFVKKDNRDCVAILQLWLDQHQSIRLRSSCIVAAIACGNVGALEWFLHTCHASQRSFRKAFRIRASGSCPKSMLWWWANSCHLGSLGHDSAKLEWEPLTNPIHAHLACTLLKMPCVPFYDTETLSASGSVAMLKYLHDNSMMPSSRGFVDESVLIAATDCGGRPNLACKLPSVQGPSGRGR